MVWHFVTPYNTFSYCFSLYFSFYICISVFVVTNSNEIGMTCYPHSIDNEESWVQVVSLTGKNDLIFWGNASLPYSNLKTLQSLSSICLHKSWRCTVQRWISWKKGSTFLQKYKLNPITTYLHYFRMRLNPLLN